MACYTELLMKEAIMGDKVHTTTTLKIKKTKPYCGKGPLLFLLRSQLKPKNAETKLKCLLLTFLTHG